MYNVLLFGSHPDEENDDCWTGEEYPTLAEALVAYHGPINPRFAHETAYVEIDGPDINMCRPNPDFKPRRDDGEWRREYARQEGMMGGCEAYNDAMGY